MEEEKIKIVKEFSKKIELLYEISKGKRDNTIEIKLIDFYTESIKILK